MDEIEQRARELLAAEFDKCGNHGAADDVRHAVPMSGARIQLMAVRAIIAALTPPDGYVLVPVEPTDDEVRVANEAQQEFFEVNTMSMFFSSGHYNEESIRQSLRAVRTARPEAPNVND